jgi:hypothetical protein
MGNNIEGWFQFVVHWMMVPLSTIWIFDGARCVLAQRTTKSVIALGFVGTAYLLGHAAVGAWAARSLDATLGTAFSSAQVVKLPSDVLTQMPPSERVEKTRLLAQMNFASTGVLTAYSSADGTTMTYAPTQSELREREKQLEGLGEARARIQLLRTNACAFVIAVVVAVAAGVASARAQRRER